MKLVILARRLVAAVLLACGVITLGLSTWLMLGGPILIDRYLVVNDAPRPAAAIVCVGSGIGEHLLPLGVGWQAIYTAVQLHADGYAPVVVFSGGGGATLSEAEVYAEVAGWLGLPREAVVLDPTPGSTAEHPRNLLNVAELRLSRETPLLVVTFPLHARRTELCFRKAGFTNVRVVTAWEATTAGPDRARGRRTSAVAEYRPVAKSYGDPLNRLRWGLDDLLTALHELAAIGVYKLRGTL